MVQIERNKRNDKLLHVKFLTVFFALLLIVACAKEGDEVVETAVPPTLTPIADVEATSVPISSNKDFIVVATDAPNPPFTKFDPFGNVTGYIQRIMAEIGATAGLEYEFVVTPYEGVLDSIAAGSNRDFDAVMSSITIPQKPQEGIAYSDPYLEIGQVMVVLVDEDRIQTTQDIQSNTIVGDMLVGVAEGSYSEDTARQMLALPPERVANHFGSSVQALQALIDEQVTAVIIENHTAEYYTETYPDRLRIIGGNGPSAWISSRAYGIAVAADNQPLLDRFNEAITAVRSKGALTRISVELIPTETLRPGESRAGTAANQLVIGLLGNPVDTDPAGASDLMSWEIKSNIMSGLYAISSDNQLLPMLAANVPSISEDRLEYTISIRPQHYFSDGSELTADDVKWSVDRSRSLGHFLVNGYLKDSDGNGFADDDAVQVIDQYTVKFVLQEPTSYFVSILTTPPYFPISNECFTLTWDLSSNCGGIGPYTVVAWEAGEQMQLQANPEWPGRTAPAFENIVLRFFNDAATLRTSLEKFNSIDLAWTGFPYSELVDLSRTDAEGDGTADYRVWDGGSIFKSYLIFNHDAEPWNNKKVRQAAALAIDRAALAALFDGSRTPLFSPVPDGVPGQTAVFPQRNLPQARTLLLEVGYSQNTPLPIELWYLNDGRYSSIENEYANSIKSQLEETGVFQVTLQGASIDELRPQINSCNTPFYLIGWPTPGHPPDYLDTTSWTDFFVQGTDSGFCSNYESAPMNALVDAARGELDEATRLALYGEIQQLWAEEFPTLDLLQERRFGISLPNIDNVHIDAMGLLHYELLTKRGG